MNDRFIKINFTTLDSDMYKRLNSAQRDVLIQILSMVNYKEKSWIWNDAIFTCKAGQFVTSLNSIKEKCAKDVTIQNIRTAIKVLEKWGFLTNQSTKSGRLITICNYDKYQQNKINCNNGFGKESTKHQQTVNKELTPTLDIIDNIDINNIYTVFKKWNDSEIIVHKDISSHKSHIKSALSKYSLEEIVIAIKNYKTILDAPETWLNHRWTLSQFLKQSNAIDRFLPVNFNRTTFKTRGGNNDNKQKANYRGIKSDEGKYSNLKKFKA